ncbi:hypothetical protein D3C84_1306020 [compost metagenome]
MIEDKIEYTMIGIEFGGESSHVAGSIRRTFVADGQGESDCDGNLLTGILQET